LNHAIRTSISLQQPVVVTPFVCAGAYLTPGMPTRGENVSRLLKELLAEIDIPPDADVRIEDRAATQLKKITVEEYEHPYYPSKNQWKFGPYGRVCVQVDNSQVADNCARAFRRHEREALFKWLSQKNHVMLGKPLSVSECAEVAATSDLFIGMDSGMSHLCHSVGTPVLLLDWEALDRFHPKKKFLRFNKVSEAIKMAELLEMSPSLWLRPAEAL